MKEKVMRLKQNGKFRMKMSTRTAWTGFLFVIPFVLGFLFFFLRPLLQSLMFAFSNVDVDPKVGYMTEFVKWDNLNYIFREDPKFTQNLVVSLQNIVWQVPVIVISALFFAIILNKKFRGRIVVRAIFFLPVIIGSSIVLNLIQSDAAASSALSGSIVAGGQATQSDVLQEILIASGVGDKVVTFVSGIVDSLFSLTWKTGIQMIIFLAGLQSIPSSLYEASAIEGATAWENFWKITIPMLSPIIFLNLIYTMVDSFTDADNAVMQQVVANSQLIRYGWASAMAWSYFLIIGVVIAVVFLVFWRINKQTGSENY